MPHPCTGASGDFPEGLRFTCRRKMKKRSANPAGMSAPENEAPEAAAAAATSAATPGTFCRLFAIDPRSLAAFRIAIGLLLLADLGGRLTDLHSMYTDSGMFPRAEIQARYTTPWNWSFHFGGGSAAYQSVLFALAFGAAGCLVAGYRSRWAALISWLLLLSIQNRVPPILNAGDGLLRLLLFWGLFLPLGCYASLDRRAAARTTRTTRTTQPARSLKKPKSQPSRTGDQAAAPAPQAVISVASAAILLQMAFLYFFSAIYKSNPDWYGGRVIEATLAHDFYARPLGEWLLRFPQWLAVITVAVFVLEWAGPLLLFAPWKTARLRIATVACLAAMHLGIAACLHVGPFSFIALAGLILFLPAEFWEMRLFRGRFPLSGPPAARAPVQDRRLVVGGYRLRPWDAVCGLLLAYVIWLNIAGVVNHWRGKPAVRGPGLLDSALGLAQRWAMFDEAPSMDGWYVARARLRDGTEVDLLQRGASVDWRRPPHPADSYPNHRWAKCFREMAYFDALGFQVFREPVAKYLCRQWNARQPDSRQIDEFEFIYCSEVPDGPGPPATKFDVHIRLGAAPGRLRSGAKPGAALTGGEK